MSNKIKRRKSILNTDIILLTNEVTFALGALPIIDPNNCNHFLWYKSNQEVPDIVICQADKIFHIAPDTFLKDGHIELANLAQKYKYRFTYLDVKFVPYEPGLVEDTVKQPKLN